MKRVKPGEDDDATWLVGSPAASSGETREVLSPIRETNSNVPPQWSTRSPKKSSKGLKSSRAVGVKVKDKKFDPRRESMAMNKYFEQLSLGKSLDDVDETGEEEDALKSSKMPSPKRRPARRIQRAALMGSAVDTSAGRGALGPSSQLQSLTEENHAANVPQTAESDPAIKAERTEEVATAPQPSTQNQTNVEDPKAENVASRAAVSRGSESNNGAESQAVAPTPVSSHSPAKAVEEQGDAGEEVLAHKEGSPVSTGVRAAEAEVALVPDIAPQEVSAHTTDESASAEAAPEGFINPLPLTVGKSEVDDRAIEDETLPVHPAASEGPDSSKITPEVQPGEADSSEGQTSNDIPARKSPQQRDEAVEETQPDSVLPGTSSQSAGQSPLKQTACMGEQPDAGDSLMTDAIHEGISAAEEGRALQSPSKQEVPVEVQSPVTLTTTSSMRLMVTDKPVPGTIPGTAASSLALPETPSQIATDEAAQEIAPTQDIGQANPSVGVAEPQELSTKHDDIASNSVSAEDFEGVLTADSDKPADSADAVLGDDDQQVEGDESYDSSSDEDDEMPAPAVPFKFPTQLLADYANIITPVRNLASKPRQGLNSLPVLAVDGEASGKNESSQASAQKLMFTDMDDSPEQASPVAATQPGGLSRADDSDIANPDPLVLHDVRAPVSHTGDYQRPWSASNEIRWELDGEEAAEVPVEVHSRPSLYGTESLDDPFDASKSEEAMLNDESAPKDTAEVTGEPVVSLTAEAVDPLEQNPQLSAANAQDQAAEEDVDNEEPIFAYVSASGIVTPAKVAQTPATARRPSTLQKSRFQQASALRQSLASTFMETEEDDEENNVHAPANLSEEQALPLAFETSALDASYTEPQPMEEIDVQAPEDKQPVLEAKEVLSVDPEPSKDIPVGTAPVALPSSEQACIGEQEPSVAYHAEKAVAQQAEQPVIASTEHSNDSQAEQQREDGTDPPKLADGEISGDLVHEVPSSGLDSQLPIAPLSETPVTLARPTQKSLQQAFPWLAQTVTQPAPQKKDELSEEATQTEFSQGDLHQADDTLDVGTKLSSLSIAEETPTLGMNTGNGDSTADQPVSADLPVSGGQTLEIPTSPKHGAQDSPADSPGLETAPYLHSPPQLSHPEEDLLTSQELERRASPSEPARQDFTDSPVDEAQSVEGDASPVPAASSLRLSIATEQLLGSLTVPLSSQEAATGELDTAGSSPQPGMTQGAKTNNKPSHTPQSLSKRRNSVSPASSQTSQSSKAPSRTSPQTATRTAKSSSAPTTSKKVTGSGSEPARRDPKAPTQLTSRLPKPASGPTRAARVAQSSESDAHHSNIPRAPAGNRPPRASSVAGSHLPRLTRTAAPPSRLGLSSSSAQQKLPEVKKARPAGPATSAVGPKTSTRPSPASSGPARIPAVPSSRLQPDQPTGPKSAPAWSSSQKQESSPAPRGPRLSDVATTPAKDRRTPDYERMLNAALKNEAMAFKGIGGKVVNSPADGLKRPFKPSHRMTAYDKHAKEWAEDPHA